MMILSHFIEAFKVGKRFVLLDLVVKPDCEHPWQSAGPENKFVSREVWQLVYRKLQDVCRKHFSEYGPSVRCELDVEYKYRLKERPNILLKYEFKNSNYRDVYNSIFKADQKQLHKQCLSVEIVDQTWVMFRKLAEIIELPQEENERLRAVREASQEYRPAPANSSRTANATMSHSEYIPIPHNASAMSNQSGYKARDNEGTIKVQLDPYTPSSSWETIPFSYVPNLLHVPFKQEIETQSTVSSTGESSIRGRRRVRHLDIYGSSDDEQEEQPFTSPKKQDYNSGNQSLRNINVVGSSSAEIPALGDNKRTQLPRKTKNRTPCSPDNKSSQASSSKRRRKDCEPVAGTSSKILKSSANILNNSGRLELNDGNMAANKERKGSSPTGKVGDSRFSSKSVSTNKENEKRKKDTTAKREATASGLVPPVDQEKHYEGTELMRNLASLNDFPILNCFKLSIQEIMDTFDVYRDDLQQIFDKNKNQTARQRRETELHLCCSSDWVVTSVFKDEQRYQMIRRLMREFVPSKDRGKYTEFFSWNLLMEWGLRIWMKMFNYEDRTEALDRINLQEETNLMKVRVRKLQDAAWKSLLASSTSQISFANLGRIHALRCALQNGTFS